MNTVVKKVILFTVAACSTGRSMSQVLTEIKKMYPQIILETYYVEIHIEETNLYRIKKNPTLLFLSKTGEELARLEGFQETKEVQQQIEQLQQGEIRQETELSDNLEVIEKYTVYLLKQGKMVPLEVEYRNPTGVKAPRITAIRLQLETRVAELENPFPLNTTLQLVQFDGQRGSIYVQGNSLVVPDQLDKMEQILLKTLEPYGVKEIEVYMK